MSVQIRNAGIFVVSRCYAFAEFTIESRLPFYWETTLPVLEIHNLRKSYNGVKAVDGIGFSIEAGEVFGLLGPNGAGKSTTIDIIATILQPDDGEVRIRGSITSRSTEYKYRIGYVPQEISLNEQLTAAENLAFVGRLYDIPADELRRRVPETLESVGLADRSREPVHQFSGGMKRRLNIACAMVHRPDVVLMDEPTVGVDPHARAYIFEIVERLASQGKAILYTTHYMEEAERLCQRTAIIDRGKIVAVGTLSELIALIKAKREIVIEADALSSESVERLSAKLGRVTWAMEDHRVRLSIADGRIGMVDVINTAHEMGIRVRNAAMNEPDLETVFLELTGHALRD
ncbi:MAG: ABC transporter ATP-binding protein [Planctomycetes bacterium]|nr:ABC transporter ATP-binding protein [Planctomycetota bacterium]